MLHTIIEKRIPESFIQIFASVGFWNAEGQDVYKSNKAGTMGSKTTQDEANSKTFEAFVLDCLFLDCKTILSNTEFKCGRSGNHVWVSTEDNDRLILIHF